MLKDLKAELHIHVKGCKEDNIFYTGKQVIDLAFSRGYRILAFTSHDIVIYDKELDDYAKNKKILLIPGVEKTLEGRHILIYNVTNEDIDAVKTFDDLYDLKKKKNIVIIPSHPYYHKNSMNGLLTKHIDLFDGIEFCHMYLPIYNPNKKAIRTAEKHDKPLIGTSDLHVLEQLGYTYSTLDLKEFTIDGFLDAIRNKNIRYHTRRLPVFVIFKFFYWSHVSSRFRKSTE